MEKKKIRSFTDLNAWKEAHRLVLMVYRATEGLPTQEMFGLTSQTQRAAVSISSNIAEGFNRTTVNDKHRFYSTAQGSLAELQNQLLIARDLEYLKEASFQEIARQTVVANKLINGLKRIQNTRYEIQDTRY